MAASQLIQDSDDVQPHLEVDVTASAPPSPPHSPRVANGKPPHLTPTSREEEEAEPDGRKRAAAAASSLLMACSLRKRCDYVQISVPEERARRLPAEWWKTGVAFLYAVANLLFTTVVITVVHERVPDKSVSPPLPDKFFDYVDRAGWAFTVTEVNGLILCGLWLIQWLSLKHR